MSLYCRILIRLLCLHPLMVQACILNSLVWGHPEQSYCLFVWVFLSCFTSSTFLSVTFSQKLNCTDQQDSTYSAFAGLWTWGGLCYSAWTQPACDCAICEAWAESGKRCSLFEVTEEVWDPREKKSKLLYTIVRCLQHAHSRALCGIWPASHRRCTFPLAVLYPFLPPLKVSCLWY